MIQPFDVLLVSNYIRPARVLNYRCHKLSVNLHDMNSEDLRSRALDQMLRNVRTGFDPYYGQRFTYVMPSVGRYQWQWFWDSCFHVIALSMLDMELAKAELVTLLTPQRADGFVGHMTYWGRWGAFASAIAGQSSFGDWRRRNSGMIQPPVLAHALLRVVEESGDVEFRSGDAA